MNHGFALANNKLFVFGGFGSDNYLNDLYMLDPSTNTWSDLTYNAIGTRPSPPRYGSGLASANNKLFVFGGWSDYALNDLYMLDPLTNTWSDLTHIATGTRPSPRYNHGFASAINKLFIFGGDSYGRVNDLFMLDPSTNTWSDLTYSAIGTRPSPRFVHGFASANSKLFVFGGWSDYGQQVGQTLNDLYMLDPSTNTWSDLTYSAIGPRPPPRWGHGFASADNKLFVFGGMSDYALNDLYMLDPSTNTWSDLTYSAIGPRPPPRWSLGLASANSKLFLFGGASNIGNTNDTFELDLPSMTWSLSRPVTGVLPGFYCFAGSSTPTGSICNAGTYCWNNTIKNCSGGCWLWHAAVNVGVLKEACVCVCACVRFFMLPSFLCSGFSQGMRGVLCYEQRNEGSISTRTPASRMACASLCVRVLAHTSLIPDLAHLPSQSLPVQA